MTRKDYEALAAAFARTRPNADTDPVGYAQWEATIRAVCDELEEANPAFDRQRFQFAATEDMVRGNDGRATIWLVDYRFNLPAGHAHEADAMARSMALRDVPNVSVKVLNVRRTPRGTYVVTVKRDRTQPTEGAQS